MTLVSADGGIELRAPTFEEIPAFVQARSLGFGGRARPKSIDHTRQACAEARPLAAFDGDRPVGASGAIPFQMRVGDALAPAAGITWVSVIPTHVRRGILTRMMRHLLEEARSLHEPLAALYASETPIYGRFGFGVASHRNVWSLDRQHGALEAAVIARGQLDGQQAGHDRLADPAGGASSESLGAPVRLCDVATARSVFPRVYEAAGRNRNGWVTRSPLGWEMSVFHGIRPAAEGGNEFLAYCGSQADPTGYVRYRVQKHSEAPTPSGDLIVKELVAANRRAYRTLWSYCLGMDLIGEIHASNRPVDEPLQHMLADPRRLRQTVVDGLWLRLVDVPDALGQRAYSGEGRLVMEIHDAFCPWNQGRYRLEASESGATCEPTTESSDLSMPVSALASMYLGGVSPLTLSSAGLIEEEKPGALAIAEPLFEAQPAPWCVDEF